MEQVWSSKMEHHTSQWNAHEMQHGMGKKSVEERGVLHGSMDADGSVGMDTQDVHTRVMGSKTHP